MSSSTVFRTDANTHMTLAGTGTWRRLANVKIEQINGLLADCRRDARASDINCISDLIGHAKEIIEANVGKRRARLRQWWTGEQCDQTWRLLHEAEARAVSLLPRERRAARMREILADAAAILDPHDPVLDIKPSDNAQDQSSVKAHELVARYRQAWDDRYVRSRNYRNRLLAMIAIVTLFVAIFVVIGWLGLFSIASTAKPAAGPPTLVWPTWEPRLHHLVAMVAIGTIGAVGGVLAGARQVAQMGGVYNPFYLPLHSLILKFQLGALTALAGTLVLLGGIAPEIKVSQWSDLAAWALIFGASQQVLTQLVDRKVDGLVSSEPRAHGETK